MKPNYLQKFTVLLLFALVNVLNANQKDDVEIVNKFLELYPELDLTKEANLHVDLVTRKYGKDLGSFLKGKIFYVKNQKASARKMFAAVGKDSEHFLEMVMTFYGLASSEKFNDASGIKESSSLFVDNKLWVNFPDRESNEWKTVEKIFRAYTHHFRNDRTRIAELKKVLKELGIDLDGEMETTITGIEKKFINNWADKASEGIPAKQLESFKKKLEDIEFGEKKYQYFASYPLRARVLLLLGKTDEALSLLKRTKKKLIEYDELQKEFFSKLKDLSPEQQNLAFSQRSVLAKWYYAKAVSLFHKYRTETNSDLAKEYLYGKQGSVVNFYLAVKNFPENNYSYKSIIAYQKIREIISSRFSRNLRELSVSSFIQGKAFYSIEDYENAYKYLTQATMEKEPGTSYDAYNLAIGTAVKLKNWESADKLFAEMIQKHSIRNQAPKDYITKLTNFLIGSYLKQAKESKGEKVDEFEIRAVKVFQTAGLHGNKKANAGMKYLLANKLINKAVKNKDADALKETEGLVTSLVNDHILSIESAKILRSMGLAFHRLSKISESIAYLEDYLTKIKSFSSEANADFLKMKLFLTEVYLGAEKLDKANGHLRQIKQLILKVSLRAQELMTFKENISGIELRILYAGLNQSEIDKEKYEEFIRIAEAFIDKYQNASSRPYIMGQVATLYQKMEQMDKANTIYTALQIEYPDHKILQNTSINQVMALINERKGHKALELLASSDQLERLSAQTVYAFINQIDELIEEFSIDDSKRIIKIIEKIDFNKIKKPSDQALALIKANAYVNLEEIAKAEAILQEMISTYPRGPYIIDMKVCYGKCLTAQGNFAKLSKVYSSITSMIGGLNKGRGSADLSLKVAAQFSDMFSKAEDEKYLKKGKAISFLASQYNPKLLDKLSKLYLEKSTYWNAWYSNKLKMADFLELKKDFLRRYPSSNLAPELRKL